MADSAAVLLLSDARGVYIPRDFVQSFDMKEWHIDERDADECNDPELKSSKSETYMKKEHRKQKPHQQARRNKQRQKWV